MAFPFLFGRAFIEAGEHHRNSELHPEFPFLFGRTFIEAAQGKRFAKAWLSFPFLFGGAFIEGVPVLWVRMRKRRISLPFRKGFH